MRSVNGYLPSDTYPDAMEVKPFSILSSALTPVTTLNEHIIPEVLPCFNQSKWGSCVLNAWVGNLEILKALETGKVEALSIAWLYALVRLVMKTFNEDSGTYPYLAADRIEKVGVVPHALFPYVEANMPPAQGEPARVPVHPPGTLYVEASDNKITSFYRINEGNKRQLLDDVDTAVNADHPVVWGGNVNVQQIENFTRRSMPLEPPTSTDGGHSTLITGRRAYSDGRRAYKIRNSWGPDVSDNGYFWIWDTYLVKGSDFWAGTRMPGLII